MPAANGCGSVSDPPITGSENMRPNLPSVRPEWLALQKERPIEPALAIIDAHQHLWEFENGKYMIDEYLADAANGHAIAGTVYVQAFCAYRPGGPESLRPAGETEHAVRLAREGKRRNSQIRIASAIVGYADLLLADQVAATLEEHMAVGEGRFRGVRAITARDDYVRSPLYAPPERDVLGNALFVRGAKCLQQRELSFDCYVFYHQLDELTRFARQLSNLPIAINHSGGILGVGPHAGRRDSIFQIWRSKIVELARCDNVYVKLGGMGMTVWGFGFDGWARPPTSMELAEAWRPYVETCIAAFGVRRCMFQANFPMDKVSFGYSTVWNAFKRLCQGASVDEKAALFRGTAQQFYKMNL
jgi:predicted TIM-barrel fold metal-dependent hydrolase